MAKKIDSAIAQRLTALGIKAKNEDDARAKLLKILADNDIDGMEEEDTDSLLDMAESMVDVDSTDITEEDDDRSDDEREADELAEEVAKEDGDEDEPEDEPEDELEEEDEEDDDEDEDDEEDEKPAKKSSKKSAEPAKKSATPAKAAKTAKKTEKKEPVKKAEKKPSKRGVKLDPMHNEDDRKAFKFLKKFFPTDKYEYRWLATNGVTIKYKGTNSSRAVVLIETCSKQDNGDITCNLFLITFSKSLQQLDDKGIEYEVCWSGAPFLRGITFTEVEETIAELFDLMEETVSKIDKRLGDNRKKMEASLKKTTKKEAAKKATKTVEPEDEDEEDDDEEDEKPAKKSAAKATKKSTKKATNKVEPDDDEEEDDEDEPKKSAKKAVKKSKK